MERYEIDPEVLLRIQNPVKNWAAQLHFSYAHNVELALSAEKHGDILEYLVLNTNVIRDGRVWMQEYPDLYEELKKHFAFELAESDDDPLFVDEEIDIALPMNF